MKKHLLLIVLSCWVSASWAAITSISINVSPELQANSITTITITDVQVLLQKACNCPVTINDANASVQLVLPNINVSATPPPNRFQLAATVPYFPYPDHDYSWVVKTSGDKIILQLSAKSLQGVSFGLYGLLQEKLGFKFYHPRETYIPKLTTWPLNQPMSFEGKALFDKKGFHLHTQHPLELTEQLHDPTLPHALDDIKEYLNWLARNGQTYFEFCLLEGIDRDKWITHAKAMVDYGHSRGLLIAVDMSLHTIQQRTFKLYTSPSFNYKNKEKQIAKNLQWLMLAGWDMLSMEFNTAEFVGGDKSEREKLRLFIIDWLQKNSHAKLMGRKHIVQDNNEVMSKNAAYVPDSASLALDKKRGLLVHTVMCYDMTEPHAPVYENENQRHQFELLKTEMKDRETWYYPESAYWISFDNSVPMLLLPYLQARLNDIDTCVKYNVPGHLTFSSGWEWGYWLIDWSIARWSWQYTTNGNINPRTPTQYVNDLFKNDEVASLMCKQLQLQQTYLKDSNLMQYMTGMTATDELPFFNKEFQPRPDDSYKNIRRKISMEKVEKYNKVLPQLKAFCDSSTALSLQMKSLVNMQDETLKPLLAEWADALHVTGLRAQHRSYTLAYLLGKRTAKLQHQKIDVKPLLASAVATRNEGLKLVTDREAHYRYPVASLASKHKSHTAYAFGYLYPDHILYFWHREELQAKHNNYRALYHSIYDLLKIVGVKK